MIGISLIRHRWGSDYDLDGRICEAELAQSKMVTPAIRRALASMETLDLVFPKSLQIDSGAAHWVHHHLAEAPPRVNEFHVVAALAVVIELACREPVDKAQIVTFGNGKATIAVPWSRMPIAEHALHLAVRITNELSLRPLNRQKIIELQDTILSFVLSAQKRGLAPNTLRFAHAALKRRFPVLRTGQNTIQIGWGQPALVMDSSMSNHTSTLSVNLARNTLQTYRLLADYRLPVPKYQLVQKFDAAVRFAEQAGWPVVVKPAKLDPGMGAVLNIGCETELREALRHAATPDGNGVLVEKQVTGDNYRLLVVKGRMLMATRRMAGQVIGDGRATISQLVKKANLDPRRGTNQYSLMVQIALDEEALHCLSMQNLNPESVPETGRAVRLRSTASISTGGGAEDVTSIVHKDNAAVAERAARLLGLDVAGVDMLSADITRSHFDEPAIICGVNAQPSLRPHWLSNPSRDINGEILDRLLEGRPPTIPTAAVTGTNGKTTTVNMLHAIWQHAGITAGKAATTGVWVGEDQVTSENLCGEPGARLLFADPTVEAAVIEMSQTALGLHGHPCRHYDVVALTNVQRDHLGRDGVNSLKQLAADKAKVLERATRAVVVNAEDKSCMDILDRCRAERTILVASDAGHFRVREHLITGGQAVVIDILAGEKWITFIDGSQFHRIVKMKDIPATMNGLVKFNETNALFAAAMAWGHDLAFQIIAEGLSGFQNSLKMNPGRVNFINDLPFTTVLDSAHSQSGLKEICKITAKLHWSGSRIVVCQTIGNRHADELLSCAPILAAHFDRFVLGHDREEIVNAAEYDAEDPHTDMLHRFANALREHGVPGSAISVLSQPVEGVLEGLSIGRPGDQLLLLAELENVLPALKRFLDLQKTSQPGQLGRAALASAR